MNRGLLLQFEGDEEGLDEDEDEFLTITEKMYDKMITHPETCLSMQPRFFDYVSDSDEETDAQKEMRELTLEEARLAQEAMIRSMAVSSVTDLEGIKTEQLIDKDVLNYENLVRKRWYIIPGRSMGRYYWDMFVMTLALYNSFMAPFEFSFDFVMTSSRT